MGQQAPICRPEALEKGCDKLSVRVFAQHECDHLFHCGAGNGSLVISYDGIFRLCADLVHTDCTYDLRRGTLAQAWKELVPRVRDLRSSSPEFLSGCRRPIVHLCL
jgi:hypothetical protein